MNLKKPGSKLCAQRLSNNIQRDALSEQLPIVTLCLSDFPELPRILPDIYGHTVTVQQGMLGDAVPWPERAVSSHHLLFFQAAVGGTKGDLNSYGGAGSMDLASQEKNLSALAAQSARKQVV